MAKLERVQKYLAHQGVGSRRTIEKLINAGRVSLNGAVITEQGTKIDPDADVVAIDGDVIDNLGDLEYYWFNKPAGVVSSSVSQSGEPTVVEYIDTPTRIYPVGRLDKESRGLLLLTNDGMLTHRLTHPKFHIAKIYQVTVKGHVSNQKLQRLRRGIKLEEGKTAPAEVTQIKSGSETMLIFTLHEGKNRQIRRMCGAVNLEVIDLQRIAFGPITLEAIPEGTSREATVAEIRQLYTLVGL